MRKMCTGPMEFTPYRPWSEERKLEQGRLLIERNRGKSMAVKETKEPVVVRLDQATLDDKSGQIVAHGWLNLEALQNLRVGDYQREILEVARRKSSIRDAVKAGLRLPDIMLGMRGQNYTSRGGAMLLENDVFIIDGLQRVAALRKHAADNPEEAAKVRIGAEVRFDTTRDTEEALFTILNVKRRAMSPSVILRNKRNHSDGVATLYGLSMNDRNFALYGKVCWDQEMHRGELTTAVSFDKTCITLLRHTAPGGRQISSSGGLPKTLDAQAKASGLQNFRGNIHAYFEVLDEVWGLRGIKYSDRATNTRVNFMIQLAAMFSDHEEFWDGNKLVLDASQKTKLKSFPIDDPTIIRLAGAGSAAGMLLYRHMIDHMNKGRQASRHLIPRRMEAYHKNRETLQKKGLIKK